MGIQNADGSEGVGLTVTMNILDATLHTWVVEGAATLDEGKGAYSYDFTSYDPSHTYLCRADIAGVTGWIRYAWGEIEAKHHVWDVMIENSRKAKHLLSACYSFARGLVSGASGGPTTLTYRNDADNTDRLTVKVDSRGNRTDSTLDVSDIP